jgi:hypothetical protein
MRFGAFVFVSCATILPAIATAQTYSGNPSRSDRSVIRPAETVAWRNYVTVPDGPCGPPMPIQADTYEVCRPCGPLHPICFIHRVGQMLDCLLPCNMCCRGGGGCGLFHGCCLGGRCGDQGACGCGGQACQPNPCGSAFAPCCGGPSCTTVGLRNSCSSAVPALSDPFRDDPPTPIAHPAEVRRGVTYKTHAMVSRPPAKPIVQAKPAAPAKPVVLQRTSPYKIVSPPADLSFQPKPSDAMSGNSHPRKSTAPTSVLRRASADETGEPRPLPMDSRGALPIIRSQSPDDEVDDAIPLNPLRK